MSDHPPRIEAFRNEIIGQIPRVPNTRATLADMQAMPTRKLISAYVTWRMRLIPAKPRAITVWSGGLRPWEFQAVRPRLRPFLRKVETGADLSSHLSELVTTKGIVLPGSSASAKGQDIDMVLTRYGLHHFHIGERTAVNPKGRSGSLLLAKVLEAEFRILALGSHQVFKTGSPEQLRFLQTCFAYVGRDVPPGQGFMVNPVMSSGHSMLVVVFADKCEDQMERLDARLDHSDFATELYRADLVSRSGAPVTRPASPVFAWHFEDLEFGIIEKQTRVFFSLLPFFGR